MAKVDDGGPAFGGISAWMKEFDSEGKCVGCWPSMSNAGMSLRDYFAAKAMGDVMVDWRESRRCNPPTNFETDAPEVARYCYLMADAMLAARKGTQ